ncbi:hypothetical protein COW36_21020 [bacterium (Candidatus Blackallbacteria) CG17_big_fil_post_rev_8_21_14_2_50_48_46]|uniref:histidine kinase n=1 Tax=bacterium (Candidatus Blackallbacteria) CG17_big_fil_post_rev_8_21_14_2_50_48_46 TaxID=2014261 RepID=A0A2M7FZ64_9BACT|nr:MAG: hypothetical protein COW64_14330 [bacterium (Candidatus Blackallbacteria) CG18_big_fil_WC_8_21_14_2_50_49_26]PIW14525.1 MAG: hypothetical protein COW36_21020 [bacterium (Candidatus Blackallbacteria) CG17_big_fil_post_rev_8_21_14_2_50_48_46]PIW47210.1 MAG: hypothetical protein COW20_13465 [bacterium (Candidatus Blackallbacteria) CG13_big_fil_rev_8_21_14_2_50_49_14]
MELIYGLLHKIPFFQNLPYETLKSLVDTGSIQEIEPDQTLFHEGDAGDALYLILSGEVAILAKNDQGEDIPLASLEGGSFFGELALAEGGVRTATAITQSPCQLFKLKREAFFAQMAASPKLLSQVISAISEKVRSANQHLFQEQLQKQALQLEIGRVQRQTVTRMVHGLSQELNAPLQSANAQLDQLLNGLSPEKQAQGEELRFQLNRAQLLVQSLQAVAPGEIFARREDLLWPHFFAQFQELYRASSFRKLPLELHLSPEASPELWQGYPSQMSEVLMHLISNCEAHAYPLSDDPVGLSLDLDGEHFILRVQDTGLGIAPQILPQIRTPFFSTRKAEGYSGLGLAVVDNLVSSVLGGEMTIDSEAGTGTTVTLRFPRQAPQQS